MDPNALNAGLVADGRVALTGLFFDTGKSALKPESKAQLDSMAELLKRQPALSLARAQAVVAALTAAPYQVDAQRLTAKVLASMAPLAGNGDDAGRAKNRRVELVAQ